MAARTRRTTTNEKWRERIQTSMLINRLTDYAVGNIELTQGQVRAIEILLKKTAPDLSHTTGDVTHTVVDQLTERLMQAREQASADRSNLKH